jgi:hypothetical protein
VLFYIPWTSNASEKQNYNDWDTIWQRPMPAPETVEVKQLGELGEDLENRKWQMISTQYHQIYYQPSTDIRKISEIYSLIDNIYTFLEGRSPAKLKTPIKAFLVPNESGRSRCDKLSNAMRTGDQGDTFFMLTSLLHEETHLFNFAFLNNIAQGWWAGEFTCIYYQQRALWQAQGKDVKKEIASMLPNGPRCHLSEIDKRGKQAFEEAISALYFFEEKYGRKRANSFRLACLEESKRTNGKPLPDSTFAKVFGQDIARLEQQWLQFYGWAPAAKDELFDIRDPRLNTKVSYTADKASVQNIVQAMANKAGLQYNWKKSQAQTDPLCRRWVRNVGVNKLPLHEALIQILDPVGLSYKLEEDAIVLYKK